MMNILIVEDEELYADQLQMLVRKLGHTPCAVAERAEETLGLFEKYQVDLALIDINLSGEMNGLELGKWLRRFSNVPIIYITSHYDNPEFFEKASHLAAFGFVKKPIEEKELQRTITLALNFTTGTGEKLQSQPGSDPVEPPVLLSDTLVLHMKSRLVKINQQDILFIEADDKYCVVHLEDGREFQERISLRELGDKLLPDRFAQSHRSFIVNLEKVEEIDTSEFTIKIKDFHLPLGNTYKHYFLKKFGA